MGRENLTAFREGFNQRDPLSQTLEAALLAPASLRRGDVDGVIAALQVGDVNPQRCRLAVCASAAVLYSRPDLFDAAFVDQLGGVARVESLPGEVEAPLVRLFRSLAATSFAPEAWTRLSGSLRDDDLGQRARARLLPLVSDFVAWRADLVQLDDVLSLAAPLAPEQRAFLLDYGVEPFVFCAPEAFTRDRLERMASLFADAPRYRYTLRFLAARHILDAEVHTYLARQMEGCFPYHQAAAAILRSHPVRTLVVLNINCGRGDDVVRVAPLLQALLDANPQLTVTLIAKRVYLFDNSRVSTVRIQDDEAIGPALAESYDAVFEVFQPDRADQAHRFDLHDVLQKRLAESPPALLVRAELGRIEKGQRGLRSEFLFQSVQLAGREIAGACGLNQRGLRRNYEPCLRLLAELGLPQRVADEAPATESLLAGQRSPEAERVWDELTASGRDGRTVALVNPFGSAWGTKGFYNQDAYLAAEIAGLVDEGCLVVVLPNGTEWGRRTTVLGALSHLDPPTRARVRVAPDPTEPDPAERLQLSERPEVGYADRVMRLFKFFATYADLVVTVEDWLAHLAYNLGRPFRLFLAAGSFTPDWYPYGRGCTQRLATAFSPHSRATVVGIGLHRETDEVLLPHHPKKSLLHLALAGLGAPTDAPMIPALRDALASPDSDVRTWAIGALGRIAPLETKQDLLAALQGNTPTMILEAANALLRSEVDCERELGPRYRDVLEAYRAIIRQAWDEVARIGPTALPALFRAGRSGSDVLAREARGLLRRMLAPYVPGLPSEPGQTETDRDSSRRVLASALPTMLTSPASVDDRTLELLANSLRFDGDDVEICELALATAAALLYARPDLVGPALVEKIGDLLGALPLPETVAGSIVKLFEVLATGPHASRVWKRLTDTLQNERLDVRARQQLIPLVGHFVHWRKGNIELDHILALGRSPALADQRPFLLDHGVEPFVSHMPEVFTVERLKSIRDTFGSAPRYPYLLYSLANRQALGREARDFVLAELAGRFPHQETAAAILEHRPLTIFVVMNVGMGQGDDVVRLVPLLQGLLDANPELSITLVTWRPYLYDNPRVTTIPIADDTAIEAALAGHVDGIVEFFQPESQGFTFRVEAHEAVERYLVEHRPAFLVKGDLGRAHAAQVGNRFSFLHQTVELNGQDIARSRGLDQSLVRNVYEPALRLLAELGLPQRTGEETPVSPSVLTGTPSADAERLWSDLIAVSPGAARRRVALLNPFGGSGVTKGFCEQDELVAAEICGLVDEGYRVIVLPNGQSWGRRDAALAILAHVDSARRAEVRVAPDPDEANEAAQLPLPERSDLAYRDRVARAFKYFAAYADLVVTVEGWLAHFAYLLGRPLRLFLAAGSYSSEYHPRNRGRAQELVTVLSPRARAPYDESALLRAGDPPPMPHRPRKSLLEVALPELGRFGGAEAVGPLRRALASPDAEVRTWAVVALGRVVPIEVAKRDLLGALQDRSPAVVREAADGLLRAEADCSRELGDRYRDLLQVHADIARQNWDAVAGVGPAALPALFKAAQSEASDVREGAKLLARKLLAGYVPDLRETQGSTT